MKCPSCAFDNPENNHFCGQCGATLDEATRRLREQVRDLIRQEVRYEESLAVLVADKAEKRLWRWSKILGIGGTLAVIGLGAFGITSFESAKKQIENAAIAASQDLKSVSEATKQSMEKKSSDTVTQIQKSGGETIAQMQSEGAETREAANSVSLRVKASNTKMVEIEQQQAAQLNTLASIRTQSPDTPIGSITTDLFKSMGETTTAFGGNITSACLGTNPPFYCPKTSTDNAGMTLTFPYKVGFSGDGVKAIQDRLATLGCSAVESTGNFDTPTAQAVDSFVLANGRPSRNEYEFSLSSSLYAPSSIVSDDSAGTVDHDLWEALFSSTAKHCPATSQQQ
jgi:hypothetical protein